LKVNIFEKALPEDVQPSGLPEGQVCFKMVYMIYVDE